MPSFSDGRQKGMQIIDAHHVKQQEVRPRESNHRGKLDHPDLHCVLLSLVLHEDQVEKRDHGEVLEEESEEVPSELQVEHGCRQWILLVEQAPEAERQSRGVDVKECKADESDEQRPHELLQSPDVELHDPSSVTFVHHLVAPCESGLPAYKPRRSCETQGRCDRKAASYLSRFAKISISS